MMILSFLSFQVSAQMKAEWAKVPVPPGALALGALTTAGWDPKNNNKYVVK